MFRNEKNVFIKFTLEEESDRELRFLGILLKGNNRKTSVLVYREPTHTTDKNLHYNPNQQTSC